MHSTAAEISPAGELPTVDKTPESTLIADLADPSHSAAPGYRDPLLLAPTAAPFQPDRHSDILTEPAKSIAGPDTAYYVDRDHRWNAKALTSLPLSIATIVIGVASQSIYLLLIGGAISFALGLIGSRQCRDRRDRGKGFAIAGMALGAAALFFSLMVLIWAA